MFSDCYKTANGKRMDSGPACSSYVQRLVMLSMVAVLLCGSFGCRCIETFHTAYVDGPIRCYRDRVWAERAYNVRFGNCQRSFETHFERGFIEGYSAVSQGGDGFVPAMPPREYWGSEYQTADGAQCVNTWFEGYPAGAAAARQDSAGNYHQIYVSKMMESAITQEKASPVKNRTARLVSAHSDGSDTLRQASARNAPIPVIVDPSVGRPLNVIPAGWKIR